MYGALTLVGPHKKKKKIIQESMLKVLQKSVEDGELEWKSNISDAEQQKRAVSTSYTDSGFV